MAKRHNWFIFLIICLLSITLIASGCGEKEQASTSPAGTPIMLATAGTGGTYYVIGGAMADVMRKYANTKVTPLTTNGSIENCRLVGAKKADIGFSTPDLVYYAYNGTEMFKDSKLDNLRYVCGGHLGAIQVVVPKNSSIQKISDLKGKRVAVGAQGSAVLTLSLACLGVGGLSLNDINPAYLSMTEMTEALQDGTVDAAIFAAGIPTSSVTNIFATKEMRLIPYSKEEVEAFLAKKGPEMKALLVPYVVPANTYRGQKEDVPCMAFRACLIAHKDTPEDVVYNFLKTIEAHTSDMTSVHPSGAEYTLEYLKEGACIPLHPGAEKFFREKGVEVKIIS